MDNQIHNFTAIGYLIGPDGDFLRDENDKLIFNPMPIMREYLKSYQQGGSNMSNKDKVLNCIVNSYPNSITRSELVCLTGLSDRAVRENIQRLRHSDNWILSCSRCPGYSLTKDARLWDVFVNDWNNSNRFNMLKKSNRNDLQLTVEMGSLSETGIACFWNGKETLTSLARGIMDKELM